MFTEGTRQFGVWKIGHPSVKRHTGRPTHAILLAYGFCAFLTWFIFILTLKVRGEFFLIESMHLPLHRVNTDVLQVKGQSPSSLTLAVRAERNDSTLRVIFDSGHSVRLPEQLPLLDKLVADRVKDIELTALLKKKMTAGLGVADLWVDEKIPLNSIKPLADLLVKSGFDTIRYAVDVRAEQKQGAH
ncbi:MAG: hypothetical protein RLZZ488_423 [Pseudomonadota bacterium]|jgi:hypothetical protein